MHLDGYRPLRGGAMTDQAKATDNAAGVALPVAEGGGKVSSPQDDKTPGGVAGAGDGAKGAAPGGTGGGTPVAKTPSLDLSAAVPLMFDLGWTVAVLYGHLRPPSTRETRLTLPTENELPPDQRIELELIRLDCLLNSLAPMLPADDGHSLPSSAPLLQMKAGGPALQTALQTFHLQVLETLACCSHELSLAYQLGRSLRDTANPPVSDENPPASPEPSPRTISTGLTKQLGRGRIAKLQQWLSVLRPHFPDDTAALVSASAGRWSQWTSTVLDDGDPGKRRPTERNEDLLTRAQADLLNQGDVWRQLLVGVQATDDLLTPEAFVAAGEAALSRTARIVRRVALHYWVALLVLAIALAAILFVSAKYLGGAAKVWTQIAAIATSLGITARGIGSGVARLSPSAERPIYQAEKLDAMAWSVTTLPRVDLNRQGVHALRRAGILQSSSLGRL
jgi:hypothetical protein